MSLGRDWVRCSRISESSSGRHSEVLVSDPVRTFYQFGWCFGLATLALLVTSNPDFASWVLAGTMAVQVVGRALLAVFNRAWIKSRVRELNAPAD